MEDFKTAYLIPILFENVAFAPFDRLRANGERGTFFPFVVSSSHHRQFIPSISRIGISSRTGSFILRRLLTRLYIIAHMCRPGVARFRDTGVAPGSG